MVPLSVCAAVSPVVLTAIVKPPGVVMGLADVMLSHELPEVTAAVTLVGLDDETLNTWEPGAVVPTV